MSITRSTRLGPALVMIGIVTAIVPGCHHQGGLRGDYAAARPTYGTRSVKPIRIGGYAAHNYGRGPVAVPVTPIEDEEPAFGRGDRSNVIDD
jgi:hypothetical protein